MKHWRQITPVFHCILCPFVVFVLFVVKKSYLI